MPPTQVPTPAPGAPAATSAAGGAGATGATGSPSSARPATPGWVTDLLGPGTALVTTIAGGSSRQTVLVERPGGARVVVRHDRDGGPLSGTPFGLAREAATYAAVARAGIPVPALRAVAADGSAFAVDLVPGEPSRGAEALDDYLAVLGRLHAAGPAVRPAGHPGFDGTGADDLAIWERIAAERIRRPAPLVALAFDALRRHGAAAPPEVVLCHGDAGAGNYLHDGATVTGLVDWEMAHTGDPHDDLASIAVRAVLAGADPGDYRARIASAYEPIAGVRFDPARHLLAVAGVLTRMVISCLASLDLEDPGQDTSIQLLGLPLMEWHLVRVLAALDGDPAPVLDAPPDPAFAAEVASVVAAGLGRDVLPEVRGGPSEQMVRRLRYATTQLAAALPRTCPRKRELAPSFGGRFDVGDVAVEVAGRLAVLPGSIAIATADVPGVDGC